MNVAQLIGEAERTWRRATTYGDSWRQITAVPEMPTQIDRATFASLFPGAEIPDEEHSYGFPPTAAGLSSRAYGISPDGWVGAIPVEPERAPRWIWAVKRGGDFYYREVPWEDEPSTSTKGHIHVGSILQIALCTVFFLRNLAKRCAFPDTLPYTLQFDAEGVSGRGLVGYRPIPQSQLLPGFHPVDEPRTLSSGNHLSVSVRATIGEMKTDPLAVGYGLVGELALVLRPDLVEPSKLKDQLRRRHAQDVEGPRIRFLGFLDGVLK